MLRAGAEEVGWRHSAELPLGLTDHCRRLVKVSFWKSTQWRLLNLPLSSLPVGS